MKCLNLYCRFFFTLLIGFLLTANSTLQAEESEFLNDFKRHFKRGNLQLQSKLVKGSVDIIPAEVEILIQRAMADQVDYKQRIALLKLARSIASMHVTWNKGSETLFNRVTTIKVKEEKREKERQKLMKVLHKSEKMLGNMVLEGAAKEMLAKGVAPAVFPHWLHRIWFQCTVCHEGIIKQKRGTNNLNHEAFKAGKKCAVCHSGKISFSTENPKKCKTCHMAGTDGDVAVTDLSQIDFKQLKKVADRVGATWNQKNLPNGKIPVDRFGFINWVELREFNIARPVISLTKGIKPEIRDNRVLYQLPRATIAHVLFDHKTHTERLFCTTCHEELFSEKLGETQIKMRAMSKGEACGHCHGKVSFTFASCLRCHNTKSPKPTGPDVLVHRVK